MSRTNHARPARDPHDLSPITNAARDVADAYRRFEREINRLQRVSKQALDDGRSLAEVTQAVNLAGAGRADRAQALRVIGSRLQEGGTL